MPLRFYILTVCSVGLISYSYRVLFGRFLVKRYKYIVSSVSEKQNVNLITLSPASNAINSFLPGQFIFVSFVSPGVTPETHPFSLTSKSGDREISIAAKSSGDYTETLKSLKEGSEAFVEGPFGRFSYLEARRKKQIWIAGGIGITPFVSMAKNFEIGNGYDVVLYYLVSDKSEAVFAEALNDISAANLGFRVKLINTHSHGRLTGEMVKADIEDFYERDIFICGPPPMMKSLRSQFNSLGIKNSHILSEEFSLD